MCSQSIILVKDTDEQAKQFFKIINWNVSYLFIVYLYSLTVNSHLNS